MNRATTPADYRALAEFRHQIRKFLNLSEQAARAAGLEPHQYQVLLAIRGLPEGTPATIRALADQLLLRHHSAVELVDRMVKHGYVRRVRSIDDRREVLIGLTVRGRKVIAKLAQQRLAEMRETGPELVRALNRLVERTRRQFNSKRPNEKKKK
ncbi:MAG TPA: MarR family transcriptional regulator [Candidatus Acidoferrales bacterium]|nr:MarR family transcriptional regulator [Candidatus Acidoferrales bacterium]